MRVPVYCLGLALLAGGTQAELNVHPAARTHVRFVDGIPMRFSSQLSKVVEMNFTFGFNHTEAKQIISRMLDKIAQDYAVDGKSAFAIQRFIGPGQGGGNGLPNPTFTLADLLSAEVVVANNLSYLNRLPELNSEAAAVFESAIKQEGRGVLGFHASAEGTDRQWDFYDQCLNPRIYLKHSSNVPVPVYKDERESGHLVLEGVLATGIPKEVPMGVDGNGEDVFRKDVVTRNVKTEANVYKRDILADSIFGPLTTPLLRMDLRPMSTADFPTQYRFAAGNPYAFILQAGRGKTGYISAGHDASEINTTAANSFDAGTGDFERFYAQMLFYLAGYKSEECTGAIDCMGLPIVDSLEHVTGEVYGSTSLVPHGRAGISLPGYAAPWHAALTDVRGRLLANLNGTGKPVPDFRGLAPGLYFWHIRSEKGPARIQRYLVPPGTRAAKR